jgi:hypothetical protein
MGQHLVKHRTTSLLPTNLSVLKNRAFRDIFSCWECICYLIVSVWKEIFTLIFCGLSVMETSNYRGNIQKFIYLFKGLRLVKRETIGGLQLFERWTGTMTFWATEKDTRYTFRSEDGRSIHNTWNRLWRVIQFYYYSKGKVDRVLWLSTTPWRRAMIAQSV